MATQRLRRRNIAILGFGREGKSLLRFLKKSPRFKEAAFEILDKKYNEGYLEDLKKFDLVFRSPGVPYNLPELKKARKAGVAFSSGTDLFFKNYRGKIIGVTGTKGKGTVSTLLFKILKSAGKKVFLAGNIGKPATDYLVSGGKYDFAILELSSFQLQDLKQSPPLAVILDIFPDHMDAHTNLKEYYSAKGNIALHQKSKDAVFYFKDNALSRKAATRGKGRKIAVDYRNFKLFAQEDLKILGIHNFRNAAMAATVAIYLKIPKKKIITAVKRFKGLEHRLEFVKKIKEVSFYNDSVSTNPQTSAAAIRSFPKMPKIVVLGGRDKRLDYKPLRTAIKELRSEIKLIVLHGENKKKIKEAIRGLKVAVKTAKTLEEAVLAGYKAGKDTRSALIFSPGAASFDNFNDYAERGKVFKKIVRSLK